MPAPPAKRLLINQTLKQLVRYLQVLAYSATLLLTQTTPADFQEGGLNEQVSGGGPTNNSVTLPGGDTTAGIRFSENSPFIGGWYDPELDAPAVGNTAIYYWNGVIDRFHPIGDARHYGKQGYMEALKNLLNKTLRPIIVDLPYHATGDMGGPYQRDTVTTDWWPAIIAAVDAHPMVLGYYLFDEPEVWGEIENDPKPPLLYEDALDAYLLVKQHTDKDTYSVFVDVHWFNQKYGGRTPFFDVFMFDAYLFKTEDRLRQDAELYHYWDYEPGSGIERERITEQMLRWKNEVIEPHAYPRVIYVGQGTGEKSIRPCGEVAYDGFGQRGMTEDEFLFMEALLMEHFPNMEGYMLWSWFYSNPTMREKGNRSLLRMGVDKQDGGDGEGADLDNL